MSYVLVTMFVFILGAAHPRFSVMFHDHFETAHCFSGYGALIVFWIHNGLAARDSAKQEGISTSLYTLRSPNSWLFCVLTSCTLLSWSRLRRRDVYPEILSDHAIRRHFKYRPMQPFYGLKVYAGSLFENSGARFSYNFFCEAPFKLPAHHPPITDLSQLRTTQHQDRPNIW